MKFLPFSLCLLAGAIASPAVANKTTSIEGVWRSPGGNSIMKIAACGHGPCGTVAWASDKAKRDSRKATPHLVGTHLLKNLQRHQDGSWKGQIFIPDMNMHASATIRRQSRHELKVSGCKLICKSAVWTEYSRPLPTDTTRPAPK
jgi:uncharacterized protein (DUF2147 family)